MKPYVYIYSIVLWIGCSGPEITEIPAHIKELDNLTLYPLDEGPLFAGTLEEVTSYGDTDEVFIGHLITAIAIDENERVYIADYRENKVHIYNPNGSYLRSIGRGGRGPGEFNGIQMIRISDGYLHILDSKQSKVSVFDLDTFQHERDIRISLQDEYNSPSWLTRTEEVRLYYRLNNFFIRPDGNYVVFFSDDSYGAAQDIAVRTVEASVFSPTEEKFLEHDLYSFGWNRTALQYNSGSSTLVMFNIPYKLSTQYDYADGRLVYGSTSELSFKQYDDNGVYKQAFYYPLPKLKLTQSDVFAYYEGSVDQVMEAIRSDRFPETWPVFNSVKIDDENRLWVSLLTDNQKLYKWWVMNEFGELQATFTWPRNRDLKQVKNGFVYALERDFETGSQKVVKYRFIVNSIG